jgi:phosphate/sulfate permease
MSHSTLLFFGLIVIAAQWFILAVRLGAALNSLATYVFSAAPWSMTLVAVVGIWGDKLLSYILISLVVAEIVGMSFVLLKIYSADQRSDVPRAKIPKRSRLVWRVLRFWLLFRKQKPRQRKGIR